MAAARALGNPYWISYALWIVRQALSPRPTPTGALARVARGRRLRARAPRPLLRRLPRARRGAPAHVDGEPEDALDLFDDAIDAFQQAGNVAAADHHPGQRARAVRAPRPARQRGHAARRDRPRAGERPPRPRARRARRPSRRRSSGQTALRQLRRRRARRSTSATRRSSPDADPASPRRAPRARGAAAQARPGGLSRREVEVLRLVAEGRTTGEIATQLFISARTAEHHIQNIYTKIGVSNRAAATRWAVEHGARRLTARRKWVGLPMRRGVAAGAKRSLGVHRLRKDTITKESVMILATTTVEDVDRFWTCSAQGRREARRARLQGLDRVPRRPTPRTGSGRVRLGRGGLGELRLRPDGPADPQGGRPPRQADTPRFLGSYEA